VNVFDVVLVIPALVVLILAVIGTQTVLRPRRAPTAFADSGAPSRSASHGLVKDLLLRLVGAALIGLALFLGVTTVHLAQAINHWQPAPASPSLTSCGENRAHGNAVHFPPTRR